MKKLIITFLILLATIVVVWAQNSTSIISKNSWRISSEGKIQCSSGQEWVNVETPTTKPMRALHFLSDNYGWAVGDNATILRWDGELWSEVLVFTDENLLGVYLTDVREGWAVGSKGTILHWNGISWDAEVSPLAETLMSVKPSPKGMMQIITQSGATLVREAGLWLVQSSDVTIPELSAKGTK